MRDFVKIADALVYIEARPNTQVKLTGREMQITRSLMDRYGSKRMAVPILAGHVSLGSVRKAIGE
jgi:hypothetical protein